MPANVHMVKPDMVHNAKTYIQANYKNVRLIGAAKNKKATGELHYEVELKGKDIFLLKMGTL